MAASRRRTAVWPSAKRTKPTQTSRYAARKLIQVKIDLLNWVTFYRIGRSRYEGHLPATRCVPVVGRNAVT